MSVFKKSIFIILHNLRSAANVGSIFRTADAAGVSKIYLTGYTPSPIDRFGRANSRIAKIALGAEKNMAWERRQDILSVIGELKKQNFRIVAVEQDKKSINYRKLKLKPPAAFIFGNETAGLSQKILNQCDKIIEIPISGQKESLNVAVAAGIILFNL